MQRIWTVKVSEESDTLVFGSVAVTLTVYVVYVSAKSVECTVMTFAEAVMGAGNAEPSD